MAFIDNLKKFGKDVAQKSSEMVETTKLNMSISQEKEKITRLYTEIGSLVYKEYKAGNDVGFGEKCVQIAEAEGKIEELQKKIMEIKNTTKCPGCGAEVSTETVFCAQCGTKIK